MYKSVFDAFLPAYLRWDNDAAKKISEIIMKVRSICVAEQVHQMILSQVFCCFFFKFTK